MGDFYNRGGGALTTTTINATTITADDLEVDGGTLSIDETNNRIGVGTTVPGTQLQVEGSAPYVTLKNDTAENTAGGCESKIIFEDHGNNALGQIEVSHVGSSDDEKGQLIIKTNNDSGLQTALTIDEAQKVTAAGDVQVTGDIILDDGGSLKEAGGTAAITFDGSGHVTKIGQDSPSSGQFLKYDGAKWVADAVTGNVAGSVAADDISAGDAAINLTTTAGNITIDAQGNDTDIIFKGTDGNADTTFLTIDGSAAGAATFNDKIIATELDISGNCDIDGTTNLDNTDIDGTLVVDGSNISLDSTSTLNIDNSNTSNGITIGTATSGVPISIGHTTSETTVNDNLTVTGDLTVNGTTTTINSTTLTVDDKTVVIASGASDSAAADGAGISIDGASATLTYAHSGTKFAMNKPLDVTGSITSSADVIAASLDISGDADIDGTLEADAITVDGTTLAEYISDTVGAMVSSNTETGITVTYQDADNTIDFALDQVTSLGTITQDTVTFTSTNANDPQVFIKNTANDASGPVLVLENDRGANNGADNDVCGIIEFKGTDDASAQTTFAMVSATVKDASNGAEGGEFGVEVATHDGEMQFGLKIMDGDAEDELDVEIGSGIDSVTTAAGYIKGANGVLVPEGKSVHIETPLLASADHSASGVTTILTASESFAIGDLVYVSGNGTVGKALSNAIAKMPAIGLAVTAGNSNSPAVILLNGTFRDDSFNFTAGNRLFAHTDGTITATAPSGNNQVAQAVGVALNADVIYFSPDMTLVEITA